MMKKIKISKHDLVQQLFNRYYGNSCGLLDKNLSLGITSESLPKILSVTSEMPMYSRTFFNDERIISYHLGGYSKNFSDAFFRLSGEAVERYSSLMNSKNFVDEFKLASANELIKNNILPLEFINVYTNEQYKKLHSLNEFFAESKLRNDEKINWIELVNFSDWQKYYVPCQMIFLSGHSFDLKQLNPSFTTGTAAHKTKEKAIINAIIESVQLHNFIEAWYLDNKKFEILKIDNIQISNEIKQIFRNKNFKINFWYIKNENHWIHTVVCYIESLDNYLPKYAFGIQSGFNIIETVKRSLMEALAVFDFIIYGSVFEVLNEQKLHSHQDLDLDSNVLTYALNKNKEPEKWLKEIRKNITNEINLSFLIKLDSTRDISKLIDDLTILKFLLKECQKRYKYLFILDITSPELVDDYRVIRAFIPENLPIIFPKFFPWDHPYVLKKNIRTKNVYIHPLP